VSETTDARPGRAKIGSDVASDSAGAARNGRNHEGDEVVSSPIRVETDKPNGPRSRKGAETRARLLAAAKEIFEENGFLDARISDIAERAGLSHGSFYHYFDSKEEVFREVAEAVEDQLSAPLGSVILDPASDATPAERIRAAIRLHMESYRQEARIMGVIEQVSRYDEHVRAARFERHRHPGHQVEESIRRLQRHGLADPTLDPVVAAAALGSMTTRFPEMWLVEGSLDCGFDEGVEQLTRVFVNALGLEDAAREVPARRRGSR
jgi:AcrR family transcriptional regulator